jgi:hypothetical protein
VLNELGVEASSVGSGTSCPGLKYNSDCFGGGGGGGDGGEAVPGLIFTMMGGEESLTGSALILLRTSALLFGLFFLDFLTTSSSFSFFHTLLLLSLSHNLLQHLAHAGLHVHPCHHLHGGGGASLGLWRGFSNSP